MTNAMVMYIFYFIDITFYNINHNNYITPFRGYLYVISNYRTALQIRNIQM